jgi:hypothetical protein
MQRTPFLFFDTVLVPDTGEMPILTARAFSFYGWWICSTYGRVSVNALECARIPGPVIAPTVRLYYFFVSSCTEQDCDTGKFEDHSGSHILSDYGSGSSSGSGSYTYTYTYMYICTVCLRKRKHIHILNIYLYSTYACTHTYTYTHLYKYLYSYL